MLPAPPKDDKELDIVSEFESVIHNEDLLSETKSELPFIN